MYLRCLNIHNNMNFGVLFLTFRSGKMTNSDRSVTFRVKLNAIIDQNLEIRIIIMNLNYVLKCHKINTLSRSF